MNSQLNDTEAVTVKPDELLDTVIEEKYKVLKLIGQGGYFKIYLAIDERLNKQWAIKVCDKNNDNYNSVIYEVIMQEAYMMMKLDHPAVPKVVDIIENERYILIVREYIEGKTLESLVKEHGAQPAEQVIEWGKRICSVLNYLHTLNPPHIHRDLKPSNLMIQADGNIKLTDYGIMISEDSQKTEVDICPFGTVGYASPEHYVGKRQMDARSDIYSIGATLYRLVTGLDPCESPYVLKPICQINPSLPKGLEYIICKCIELDKNKRYQNCAELLYDLNNYSKLPQKKVIFFKFCQKGRGKEKYQCPKSMHDFKSINTFTGAHTYKCQKCGLEVFDDMQGSFEKEYYGSYMDDINYRWDAKTMNSSEIISFTVKFGYFPIHSITFDEGLLTHQNKINFSRDGGENYPEGFFDKETYSLSEKQIAELYRLLDEIDFDEWNTESSVFEHLSAPGFCIHESFICTFTNGRKFECLSPEKNKSFYKLTSMLEKMCGLYKDYTEEIYSKSTDSLKGIVTPCCEIEVPSYYEFCPKCGRKIADKSKTTVLDAQYNNSTGWLCDNCKGGAPLEFLFCGCCGQKRSW